MAATALFFDLSLLPADADSDSDSTSRLLAAARALELGYSSVALDHPHRGLLDDSHSATTRRIAPFPPSLPPSHSAASLYRRNGSPTSSHPFRQFTRVTLSLDSAAACASALAPSAARLLRTYDLVAARPLTQAALDHLCQAQAASDHLDILSIDFSHKLPFRLKLPMLKLALQRGLHLEIAYSPLIADADSRRQVLAQAKLLADWTKGKNLIISSAACTANEIRGPYDVINLCAYLLGLSTQQAKAAISANCRSLISKSLRKKHFYKETVRIDRLLPNEQLNPSNFKFGDWIGCDPMSHKGDVQPLEASLEPSSNKAQLPGSPVNGLTKMLHQKPCHADESVLVDQPDKSSNYRDIPLPAGTQEVKLDRGEVLCGLSTLPPSFGHQNVSTILDKPGQDENIMAHQMQAGAVPSVELKSIDKHIEFVQDIMQLDDTESRKINLTVGARTPSSDDNLVCSAFPSMMELSDATLVDMCPHQSNGILDYGEACTKCDSDFTSCGRVDQSPLDPEIPSGSIVLPEDKVLDLYNGVSVDAEAPSDPVVQLHSDLCRDVMMPHHVIKGGTEQITGEKIIHSMRDKVESIDRNSIISTAHALHGRETTSTALMYDKGLKDTTLGTDELRKQDSNETSTSFDEDIDIHRQPPNNSYASGEVEVLPVRSEKRIRKVWVHHTAYLPFLGLIKSVPFKKKACKVRGLICSLHITRICLIIFLNLCLIIFLNYANAEP
ncbi:hypothetical protein E2562_020845 [Oryza meyeriana var. granulata]|uniref:RNase P subunit p30 family protein n=1 Tax=Oryza meyeriana var. granulata TaxID=110450 RepID=A0A6G1FAT3_9ORYZ|nr:hypothetical protein E2562_020845 [Oryza meyeriana var. granulata]